MADKLQDDALASGANLAALGSEVVQFGKAIPLGAGRFRLSHLLRGRGGTEWACNGHAVGEPFCLIEQSALQPVTVPAWSIGAEVAATVTGGAGASIAFAGEGLRPPSPVNLTAEIEASGDLSIAWIRRSRQGFAWIDGVDAPLGEATEQYRVLITGAAGTLEVLAGQPSLTIASSELAAVGTGAAGIEVRQIGDFAMSHPAQINVSIS